MLIGLSQHMQLEETSQANQQVWEANANAIGYSRQPNQPQGDEFFHPLDCQPTIQLGYVMNDSNHKSAISTSIAIYSASLN